jgi:hypothetical protein
MGAGYAPSSLSSRGPHSWSRTANGSSISDSAPSARAT